LGLWSNLWPRLHNPLLFLVIPTGVPPPRRRLRSPPTQRLPFPPPHLDLFIAHHIQTGSMLVLANCSTPAARRPHCLSLPQTSRAGGRINHPFADPTLIKSGCSSNIYIGGSATYAHFSFTLVWRPLWASSRFLQSQNQTIPWVHFCVHVPLRKVMTNKNWVYSIPVFCRAIILHSFWDSVICTQDLWD